MLESVSRVVAKARALLPADWQGKAGEKLRKTAKVITNYTEQNIRPEERLQQLPDLAWNRVTGEANEKHAKALADFADEEGKRIANELAKRTSADKEREAKASADKLEAEAKLAHTNELLGRIALVDRCRQIGVIPIWSAAGHMTFIKAPESYDWDGLTQALLSSGELPRNQPES